MATRFKNFSFACLLIISVLGALPSARAESIDPLMLQNRFPLHLLFLAPRPTSASLPAAGALRSAVSLDYSSIYFDRHTAQWDYLMDMEAMIADLSFEYAVTSRFALRLDAPLVNMSGGFLDGFLEDYHNALGVPNYGRENRPPNSFAYQVGKGGRTWIEGASGGLHLADMTLSAQWNLLANDAARTWHVTLMGSLKLPTGEPDQGFGSGRFDCGAFLPFRWQKGRYALYGMPGIILHSDPETPGVDISARNSYSLLLGAGYAYSPKWTWLVQFNYFSSPIEKTGIDKLDDGALELALGFRRLINDQWRLEAAFGEDPFTLAAPDFTVHIGLGYVH